MFQRLLGIGDVDWDTAGTEEATPIPFRGVDDPSRLIADRGRGAARRRAGLTPTGGELRDWVDERRRHAAAIRELALSFPTAREDHPFGPDAHVFKVGGGSTMFAIMGDGPPVTRDLKLTGRSARSR